MVPILFLLGCTTPTEPSANIAVTPPEAAGEPVTYPTARRDDRVDIHHGVEVPDPYPWLEDPDSPETRTWIDAQNALTDSWLGAVQDGGRLEAMLQSLWKRERWGVPEKRGGQYFWTYHDGQVNQAVLQMGADPSNGETILDPNTFSDDGTASLAGYLASPDGKFVQYAISVGGSDWQTFKVLDLDSGETLPDSVEWVKFSEATWAGDSSGFYYSRYPEPEDKTEANYNHAVYFHALGTDQTADTLVFEEPEHKERGFQATVSDDGRFLTLHVWEGTVEKSRIYYQDLSKPGSDFVRFLDEFDADYWFLGNRGPVFWFRTTNAAPKGRVIAIDTRKDGPEAWREIVGQSEHTLNRAALVGERLVTVYLEDAHAAVRVFELDGRKVGDVALPGMGEADGLHGKLGDGEAFFSYSSFTQPDSVFRLDTATMESAALREQVLPFDPESFETTQVFVASKDGTKIPLYLTHKKGIQPKGAPTLLYGYGGFNIPVLPGYSARTVAWLELGGVYASANLRGGGEYGEEWHQAGAKLVKQNVFDDFVACAEWLIAEGITSPDKLAINGRSNGGLLVGATVVQRPELFGAAIPAVGVLDMLKYHTWTIGWAWSSDYGTVENKAEFEALYAYSPYHNARPATYPAVMVATADHDDRVVPAHSFKFTAALQHAQQGTDPILARIETKAGHGAGKSQDMQIAQARDELRFLIRALDMELGFTQGL